MNFKRNKVAAALAYLAGLGGALAVSGVHAQQADQASNPDIRVEVTGTAIRRVEGETALPVQVITKKDIERSGATTAKELMKIVSASNTMGTIDGSSGIGISGANGHQSVSLRGLDPAHTLVLLNGHRIEGFAGEYSGVDGADLSAI